MWSSNNLHFLISTIPCLWIGVLGLMIEHSQLGLQEPSLHPREFSTKTTNNRINVLHEENQSEKYNCWVEIFLEEGSNFL